MIVIAAVMATAAIVAVTLLIVAGARSLTAKIARQTTADSLVLAVSDIHAMGLDVNAGLNLASSGLDAVALSVWTAGAMAGSLAMLTGIAAPEGINLMVESLDVANDLAREAGATVKLRDSFNHDVVPALAYGMLAAAAATESVVVPWPLATAAAPAAPALGDCAAYFRAPDDTLRSPVGRGLNLQVAADADRPGYGRALMTMIDSMLPPDHEDAGKRGVVHLLDLAETRLRRRVQAVLDGPIAAGAGDLAAQWNDALRLVLPALSAAALAAGDAQLQLAVAELLTSEAAAVRRDFALMSDPAAGDSASAPLLGRIALQTALARVQSIFDRLRRRLFGGAGEGVRIHSAIDRILRAAVCGIGDFAGAALQEEAVAPTRLPQDFERRQAFTAVVIDRDRDGRIRLAAAAAAPLEPHLRPGEPIERVGAQSRFVPVDAALPPGALRKTTNAIIQH